MSGWAQRDAERQADEADELVALRQEVAFLKGECGRANQMLADLRARNAALVTALRPLVTYPSPLMKEGDMFRVVSDEGLLYAGALPNYVGGWHGLTAGDLRAAHRVLKQNGGAS